MGEHNSPAFADGMAAKEARNAALLRCPPVQIDTYDPSKYNGYTVMYRRGWDRIPDAEPHSCELCRE